MILNGSSCVNNHAMVVVFSAELSHLKTFSTDTGTFNTGLPGAHAIRWALNDANVPLDPVPRTIVVQEFDSLPLVNYYDPAFNP